MRDFQKIWIEQCDAARTICDEFGRDKALGYLIGEKFLEFLRAADKDANVAGELPGFTDEVRDIFDRVEIAAYLGTVSRVGPLGHVATDEMYAEMVEAGAVDEDPVQWAEGILLIERAKRLLVEDQ